MARRPCRSLITSPMVSAGVRTSTSYTGSRIFGLAFLKASENAWRPASRKEISLLSTGCILPSYIMTRTSRAYEPVSGPCSMRSIRPFTMAGMNRASMAPPTMQLYTTSLPPHSRGISCLSRTLSLNSWLPKR